MSWHRFRARIDRGASMSRLALSAFVVAIILACNGPAFAQQKPKPDPPGTATLKPPTTGSTTLMAPTASPTPTPTPGTPSTPTPGTPAGGSRDPLPIPGAAGDNRLRATPLDRTPDDEPRAVTPRTPPVAVPNPTTPMPPVLPVVTAQEDAEPGQLVVFASDAKNFEPQLRKLAGELGAAVTRVDRLPALDAAFAVLQLAPNRPIEPVRLELLKRMPAWLVEPNTRLFPLQAEAPRHYAQAVIGLKQGPASAAGVKIGLIDSAVEPIPALARARIVRREFIADGDRVSSRHGTAIAALIAGDLPESGFFGVARGVELLSAAVLEGTGPESSLRTNVALVAQALDWLLAQRAQVVNISLGGSANAVLGRLVRETVKRGVVLVAAAGNGGPQAPAVYPAAYPGVIAVTAADSSNKVYPQANQGKYVLLTAPGVDVWIPGKTVGRYVSGTSFASAFVSGAIAVRLSAKARGQGIADDLCKAAADLGDRGRDPVFGCGLLQLSTRP